MTTGQAPKLREVPRKTVKPGTVTVISGDLSRYSMFSQCLIGMLAYSGELISHHDWLIGSNITGNCNDACKRMEGDWIWLIGDDHAFRPDILERLVLHDVDVVAPFCLQRSYPYPQVVYEGEDHDSDVEGTHLLHTNLPEHGLEEVYAVGGAGLLIRRHVLEAIGEPYFETFGKQNEDLEFCRKVRDAGFKIHVDLDTPLGHIGNMITWPQWLGPEHRWGIRLMLGSEPGQETFIARIGPSGTLRNV